MLLLIAFNSSHAASWPHQHDGHPFWTQKTTSCGAPCYGRRFLSRFFWASGCDFNNRGYYLKQIMRQSKIGGSGYAGFYRDVIPTGFKKILIVFKPRRVGILVAKNKGLRPSFFVAPRTGVAFQNEFLRYRNLACHKTKPLDITNWFPSTSQRIECRAMS